MPSWQRRRAWGVLKQPRRASERPDETPVSHPPYLDCQLGQFFGNRLRCCHSNAKKPSHTSLVSSGIPHGSKSAVGISANM